MAEHTADKTDTLLLKIMKDLHSPGPVRINQMVKNFASFKETWNCKIGEEMSSDEVCEIW